MLKVKSLIVLFAVLFAASCAAPTPAAVPTVAATAAPSGALTVGAILAATPTTAPSTAATAAPALSGKMRVAFTEVSNTHSIPMLMALEALQAQGVQVETTTLETSSLVAATLSEGNADLAALNNLTMWSAIGKGADVRTIMQRYFTAPIIYTRSELKTCADLNGKNIAFANTTGITPSLFEQYLEENCPGTQAQVLQVASNAMSAAIQAGTIDGGNLSIEQITELERTDPGKYHLLIDLGKAYPKVQSSGIHVSKKWAEENPALVAAFIRALLTLHRQINKDPQILIDEAVKRLGVTPEVAKTIVEADLVDNTWDQNGGMTQDNVQYTLDFLSEIESLKDPMTVEQVTDLSFLQKVLDEMGRK